MRVCACKYVLCLKLSFHPLPALCHGHFRPPSSSKPLVPPVPQSPSVVLANSSTFYFSIPTGILSISLSSYRPSYTWTRRLGFLSTAVEERSFVFSKVNSLLPCLGRHPLHSCQEPCSSDYPLLSPSLNSSFLNWKLSSEVFQFAQAFPILTI